MGVFGKDLRPNARAANAAALYPKPGLRAQGLLRGVDLVEDDEREHGVRRDAHVVRGEAGVELERPPEAMVFATQSPKPLNGMVPSGSGFCFCSWVLT